MLAADRASIRANPTLTDDEKADAAHRRSRRRPAGSRTCSQPEAGEPAAPPGRHLSRRALQAALLINLYRDEPILHLPFRCWRVLADIERNFTTWRQRHAQMAMRMIGTRIGTGGTSGHEYLDRAAERHRVFADLSALSSFFIPAVRASEASSGREEPDGIPVRPGGLARAMTFSSTEIGTGSATTPTVVRVGRIASKYSP